MEYEDQVLLGLVVRQDLDRVREYPEGLVLLHAETHLIYYKSLS